MTPSDAREAAQQKQSLLDSARQLEAQKAHAELQEFQWLFQDDPLAGIFEEINLKELAEAVMSLSSDEIDDFLASFAA